MEKESFHTQDFGKDFSNQSTERCPCDSDARFLRSQRPPYEALRPRITVVDLFSGCGGLTIGVAEAARALNRGIDIRLAVDFDQDAISVYGNNLPEAETKVALVEELFDGELGHKLTPAERRIKKQIGQVDILVGGPPCQGHSDLNIHTRRADPRNELYSRIARAAEVLKPKLILIENVPNVKHDVANIVKISVIALKRARYLVSEAVVDISRLGAPQTRKRHVLLASYESEIDVEKILVSLQERCELHKTRTVRWAIGDLVKQKPNGLFDSASMPNAKNAARIKWLFDNSAYDLPNEMRPGCHQSNHSYVSMYGRLSWKKPAQTVTTGFGCMGQGRYVHPSRKRTLTPHEAARLQLLPDFWDFSTVHKRGSLAKLIGNAVPPILAETILHSAFISLGFNSNHQYPEQYKHRIECVKEIRSIVPSKHSVHTKAKIPEPSSAEAEKRMRSIRQHDTEAELMIQKKADELGLKYEVNASISGIRSRPDLLFREAGVAVFVDGCFWHMCPIHGTWPKENAAWWCEKLEANRRRDIATDERLHEKGWVVLRFWAHEDPSIAAQCILEIVTERLGNPLLE